MRLHNLAWGYISLHAVTWACMQLHELACSYMSSMQFYDLACSYMSLHAVPFELACSYMSLHVVPFFVWAAHKNFAVLVQYLNLFKRQINKCESKNHCKEHYLQNLLTDWTVLRQWVFFHNVVRHRDGVLTVYGFYSFPSLSPPCLSLRRGRAQT